MVTFNLLGGRVVTHPTWVREVPSSIPGLSMLFMFDFVFLLFCQNTLFVTKICNFFCNVNSISILNILEFFWPILRVSIYRPSIFNQTKLNLIQIMIYKKFNNVKLYQIYSPKSCLLGIEITYVGVFHVHANAKIAT